ncbi:MAG: domain containing protein [Gemmatimonadetes bacterium]|nr:domain containing protein [Gemmatimonadota bacterium]
MIVCGSIDALVSPSVYSRFHGFPPFAVTPVASCAFCGRENEPMSRFCIDCGKPLTASAMRAVSPSTAGAMLSGAVSEVTFQKVPMSAATPCPKCAKPVDPDMPFCAHCGSRVTEAFAPGSCNNCGAHYIAGVDLFCARCGTRVGQRVSVELNHAFDTLVGGRPADVGPRLSLLNEVGEVTSTFSLDRGEAVIGRGDADIRFDDVFLSPMHARFEQRDGELWIRDLGSRNGSWAFIEQATALCDCDLLMVGSQLIRFRRLGYPGPHPPEADSTRRMGSLIPSADVAVLEQLRADGSVRDSFHLSPARTVLIGRESGDWVFPYDQTMSGKHAEIRSQDSEFYIHDAGSRNGVALGVRGERALKQGSRVLLGDQILRVESLG